MGRLRCPKFAARIASRHFIYTHAFAVSRREVINVLRSRSSQDSEGCELPDRSKTRKTEHPSNARLPETKSLRPSRTLVEYSNPVWAAAEFGLYDPSVPKTRHASGPKTGLRVHLQFVPGWHHSAVASPSPRSAPILQAHGPFGRCAASTVAELRRPPEDKSVKLETATTLTAERRSRHRTPSRTPRNFLPKV